MAIQASKPNNRIFLLLGVVLAALAFGGVLFALRSSSSGATESIVVAKLNLAAGTTLTQDQVTTASVPISAAPQDAYTDPSQVVGKTTTATVTVNTPIVPAFFQAAPLSAATTTNANGQPVDLATQIVKGYVALALPAVPATPPTSSSGTQLNTYGISGDLATVGYWIQPGDHIDILVDPGNNGVRYSFQDLIVLRVGTAGSANGTPTVLIVEVPRAQAELLTALVTLRGITKDASGNVTAGPYIVKYVIRPESEWGKLAADNSSYTPNYESSGNGSLPSVNDPTVSTQTLQSLFGH